MEQCELETILQSHSQWLSGRGGVRANLRDAVLRGADLGDAVLRGADLGGANLGGADLGGADLGGANLRGANLGGADLGGAVLRGANLRDANLGGADLGGANLRGADLRDANLRGADLRDAVLRGAVLRDAVLRGADLRGADLRDAVLGDLDAARVSIVPSVGDFTGWKKCVGGVIVRVLIPSESRRSSATGRKCRAEFVHVLEVIGSDVGVSIHDRTTEYRPGQIVRADRWCEDRWQECAGGIHFYITREEAEAHL